MVISRGVGKNYNKSIMQVPSVCPLPIHYPNGVSNCYLIEHRLFSQIDRSWAATPLSADDILLDGLHSTKTDTGLRVHATLFDTIYQKGLSITDTEMNLLMVQNTKLFQTETTLFDPDSRSDF